MSAKTGNNYISETLTNNVEIPRPNSGFSMMSQLDRRLAKWLRQLSITRNCTIGEQNVYLVISGCPSLSQSPVVAFFRAGRGRGSQIFRWTCHPICHSSRDISISGFGGHIAIFDCRSLSQSLGDTLFGLAMVEDPGLVVGISALSVVVPVV